MIFSTKLNSLTPWINSLPKDWHCTRIDNVADVLFSNVDKHKVDDEEPVRLCNYVDVYKNDRITRDLEFMEASAELREIKKFRIQRGDVLSTKDSETPYDIAISALVDDDLPNVLCGYHLALMRPRSERLHGPYLAWVHSSKHYRAQYEARAVGVTRFGLPQYAFRAASLPLPPVTEQKRIAAYLDASCAAIDAAVTAKRRQIEILDLVRGSIVEVTVTEGVNGDVLQAQIDREWISVLPAHWLVKQIKRLVVQMDYGVSVRTEREGAHPVLKMGNIQNGGIVFSKMEFIEEVPENLLLEHNDLLYNRTNSSDQVGKAALFLGSKDDGVTFASYLVRLRVNHEITPLFLNYVVNCNAFLSYARKLAIPSVQQSNLNSTRYGQLWVPLPPLFEQQKICEHITEKLTEINRSQQIIESQIETLAAYRKSLIHECVTGQRRVTDEDVKRAEARWPGAGNLRN